MKIWGESINIALVRIRVSVPRDFGYYYYYFVRKLITLIIVSTHTHSCANPDMMMFDECAISYCRIYTNIYYLFA
jgi:hypothetical protein